MAFCNDRCSCGMSCIRQDDHGRPHLCEVHFSVDECVKTAVEAGILTKEGELTEMYSHINVRCQWVICQGYDAGKQCGNNAKADVDGWKLCGVHAGLYHTTETCRQSYANVLVSSHGKWRDRKGNCRICGEKSSKK